MGRRLAFRGVLAASAAIAACSTVTSPAELPSGGDPEGGDASTDGAAREVDAASDAGEDGTTVGLDTSAGPLTGDDYAAMVKGDGPVAYWRLADTGGSTAKDEMGAYAGTWQGSPTFGVPGPFASASVSTQFTGSQQVNADALAKRPTPPSAITMELWFSSQAAAGAGPCMAQFAGADAETVFGLFKDGTTNATRAHVGPLNVVGTTTITTTAWHHLAVTVGGGTIALYLDGKVEAMPAGTLTLPTSGYFVIGADYNGLDGGLQVGGHWVGRLAEVAIYDKALDASRIAAHRAAVP